jgi:chaperonin cofactor prefoldin
VSTAQSFDKTLQEIRRALEGWQQIDPTLKLGSLTTSDVQSQIEAFTQLTAEITTAEIALTKLRNDRQMIQKQIHDSRKRILSTIKGLYGDDSNEYEMVGGTRMSERKRSRNSASNSNGSGM